MLLLNNYRGGNETDILSVYVLKYYHVLNLKANHKALCTSQDGHYSPRGKMPLRLVRFVFI